MTFKYVMTLVTSTKCPKCLMCKESGSIFPTWEDVLEESDEETDESSDSDEQTLRSAKTVRREVNKLPFYSGNVEGEEVRWAFDYKFFMTILSLEDTRIQELIFESNEGLRDQIIQINTWELGPKPGQIKQKSYTTYGDHKRLLIRTILGDQSGQLESDEHRYTEPFSSLVARMVPYRIYGYTFFFPGVLLSYFEEWKTGIANPNHFPHIYSVGGVHTPFPGNTWMLNKNLEVKDRVKFIDPVAELHKVRSGKLDLHKIPPDPELSEEDLALRGMGRDKGRPAREVKFASIETLRGRIRLNDGNVPYSNGLSYRIVPSDFYFY